MAIIQTYNFKDGQAKRSYLGFIVTLEPGYEITGLALQMDVNVQGTSRKVESFTVGNGIEILTPLSFKFSPGVLNIPAGTYDADILIPYPDREVSWISGTWIINDTVTRKR